MREEIEKRQASCGSWIRRCLRDRDDPRAEKNMNIPAAFLLKERATLSLYAVEVEKTYNDIKALASPKVQITNAQIDRDNTGRVSARLSLLLAPEESETVIAKVKGMRALRIFRCRRNACRKAATGWAKTRRRSEIRWS